MSVCKQCTTDISGDDWPRHRKGVRYTLCFSCARKNMAEWERSRSLLHKKFIKELQK